MSRLTALALTAASTLVLAACAPAAPAPVEPTPTPEAATPTPAPTPGPTAPPTPSPSPAAAPPAPAPVDDYDDYAALPTPAAPATPTATPAGMPSGQVLEIAQSAAHGDYLAVEGQALYIFTPDGPNMSTCTGNCAATWPPLAPPASGGEGVDGEFATFDRPDGTEQVSYNGEPLYFYVGDTAPGDTTGEGQGGVWFLARP